MDKIKISNLLNDSTIFGVGWLDLVTMLAGHLPCLGRHTDNLAWKESQLQPQLPQLLVEGVEEVASVVVFWDGLTLSCPSYSFDSDSSSESSIPIATNNLFSFDHILSIRRLLPSRSSSLYDLSDCRLWPLRYPESSR